MSTNYRLPVEGNSMHACSRLAGTIEGADSQNQTRDRRAYFLRTMLCATVWRGYRQINRHYTYLDLRL